jgi:O-antigen/teichoic acid export membrane protein
MQFVKGLAKNTVIYLSAQLVAKAFTFLLIVYLARRLGATDYGKFAFAYALMNLFWILARFGLESLISRDVAQDAGRAARYLGDTFQLHAYLGLLALGLMTASLLFFQKSSETWALVFFLGLAMIFTSMAESFTYTFASQERFDYQAILVAVSQILTLVLVFAGLQIGWGLAGIGIGFAGAALVYLIASWWLCAHKIASPLFVLDHKTLWRLLCKAFPFAVAGIFVSVYYRVDVLILSTFATDQVVGWYDAAHNLVWALKLIPASLAAVLLPMFSKMYLTDREKTIRTYRKIIRYVSLAAVPMVFFTFIWAESLTVILLGLDYQESGRVLRWLVWSAALIFINAQQGTILIATGREKQLLFATAVGAISNVVFNIILIPRFSLYGAATANVLSELVVGVICMGYSRYLVPLRSLASDVIKPLSFLLMMTAASVLFGFSPVLATLIALSGYIMLTLSVIPNDDVRSLKAMLRPWAPG